MHESVRNADQQIDFLDPASPTYVTDVTRIYDDNRPKNASAWEQYDANRDIVLEQATFRNIMSNLNLQYGGGQAPGQMQAQQQGAMGQMPGLQRNPFDVMQPQQAAGMPGLAQNPYDAIRGYQGMAAPPGIPYNSPGQAMMEQPQTYGFEPYAMGPYQGLGQQSPAPAADAQSSFSIQGTPYIDSLEQGEHSGALGNAFEYARNAFGQQPGEVPEAEYRVMDELTRQRQLLMDQIELNQQGIEQRGEQFPAVRMQLHKDTEGLKKQLAGLDQQFEQQSAAMADNPTNLFDATLAPINQEWRDLIVAQHAMANKVDPDLVRSTAEMIKRNESGNMLSGVPDGAHGEKGAWQFMDDSREAATKAIMEDGSYPQSAKALQSKELTEDGKDTVRATWRIAGALGDAKKQIDKRGLGVNDATFDRIAQTYAMVEYNAGKDNAMEYMDLVEAEIKRRMAADASVDIAAGARTDSKEIESLLPPAAKPDDATMVNPEVANLSDKVIDETMKHREETRQPTNPAQPGAAIQGVNLEQIVNQGRQQGGLSEAAQLALNQALGSGGTVADDVEDTLALQQIYGGGASQSSAVPRDIMERIAIAHDPYGWIQEQRTSAQGFTPAEKIDLLEAYTKAKTDRQESGTKLFKALTEYELKAGKANAGGLGSGDPSFAKDKNQYSFFMDNMFDSNHTAQFKQVELLTNATEKLNGILSGSESLDTRALVRTMLPILQLSIARSAAEPGGGGFGRGLPYKLIEDIRESQGPLQTRILNNVSQFLAGESTDTQIEFIRDFLGHERDLIFNKDSSTIYQQALRVIRHGEQEGYTADTNYSLELSYNLREFVENMDNETNRLHKTFDLIRSGDKRLTLPQEGDNLVTDDAGEEFSVVGWL